MKLMETARRLAQLGATEEALRAYLLVLNGDGEPKELLEAALYLFDHGGDAQIAYTAFIQLYNAGYFRAELLPLLRESLYEPVRAGMRERYERNCALLKAYPYIFRKDFAAFDALPLTFYPYGNGYVPFSKEKDTFLDYYEPDDPVVSGNFFRDLEKPIFADDVYSQYELEYLNDNVRPSEWVGRENHIYLHYTDWDEFCAYLQVLSLETLLTGKKLVFLIGDERTLYPIDFKKRFGVDYSKYSPRPVSFREISKLIWHTQLLAHNGGDFFNEIFDSHPNLLWSDSVLLSDLEALIAGMRAEQGDQIADLTDKDILVAYYLNSKEHSGTLDPCARIVPALFFQPHFKDPRFDIRPVSDGRAVLVSNIANLVQASPIFREFKYVKTFTPMRRPTTSHGGTMRFIWRQYKADVAANRRVKTVHDVLTERILNRAFLRDPDDRLYHDSIIVRFEDGKLNPKATFTALAAFLDIPYTESMTYCSGNGVRNPLEDVVIKYNIKDYSTGFDTFAVFARYDQFLGDAERYYIECFLRDAYEAYGYDFMCHDGEEIDEERMEELAHTLTTTDGFIRTSCRRFLEQSGTPREELDQAVEEHMERVFAERVRKMKLLLGMPQFVSRSGRPLEMTPLLKPDPALLEQEAYH